MLVLTAETVVAQGEQLGGLCTATCTEEGLGLTCFTVGGWRVEGE